MRLKQATRLMARVLQAVPRCCLAVLLLCLCAANAEAQTRRTWSGAASTLWSTGSNWFGGTAPAASEAVVFDATGTFATGTSMTFTSSVTTSGIVLTNPSSDVVISGTSSSNINFTIDGLGIDMSAAQKNLSLFAQGIVQFRSGTINVASGRTLTIDYANTGLAAAFGSGTTTINGAGLVAFAKGVYVGRGEAANTALNITSGTLQINGFMEIGNGSAGTNHAVQLSNANYSGGVGVLTGGSFVQSSGTATLSNMTNARWIGNGSITINGGIFNQTANWAGAGALVASQANDNVTLTFAGGTSTLYALPTARGTGASLNVNFNGGVFRPAATSLTFFGTTAASANLYAGNNGALIDTNTFNLTLAQPIMNGTAAGTNGFLTKLGSGTLTLSGSNSYSGGTNLNAGTLSVSNSNALGSGTITFAGGSLDAGSALTLATNNAQNWNSDFTFAGSNALNLGTGAVTLGASRTVTVSASTLTVGGAISDGGSGYQLTKAGTGTLALSGSNSYSGGTTLSAGQLNINNANAIGTGTFTISGGTIDNTSGSAITLATNNAQVWGGNFTFAGSNPLNLGSGTATFSANRTVTVTSSTLTVGSLVGSGSSTGFTKNGNGSLVITGSSTIPHSTSLTSGTTILNGGVLTAATTSGAQFNVGTSGIGTLVVSSGTLTIASTGGYLGGSGISGTGSLVMQSGVLTGSSFTWYVGQQGVGTVTQSGGSLSISTLQLANQGGSASVLISGGTASFPTFGMATGNNGAFTPSASLTVQGGSVSLGTSAVAFASGSAANASIVLSGGTLSTGGLGISRGTNATSTFTFDGGVLRAAAASTTYMQALTNASITNNGALIDTNGNNITIAQALTNGTAAGSNGFLTKSGAGTLTLSGSNSYSGGTNLNAGTLSVSSSNALGSGTITFAGGALDAGSALTLSTNNAQNWNSDFTFAGSNALNLGTGAVTLGASRTVTVTASTLTVGGAISDGGSGYQLTKAGAGTLALSGSNSYSGGTTLSAGQLNINNANAIGTGTFTISGGTIDNTSGSALTLPTNNTQVWGGNFAFAGSNPLNLGTGTATFSANRTVTVTSSTLTVGSLVGSGANSFTKAGNGTLVITGSATMPTALYGAYLNSGTTILNGGVFTMTTALTVGPNAGNNGTFVISSGTATLAGIYVGQTGTGSFVVQSGVVSSNGSALSLSQTGGNAAYTQSGGSATFGTTAMCQFATSTSSFLISGGTATLGTLQMAQSATTSATLTVQGGLLSIGNTSVNYFAAGNSSTASIVLSGGTMSMPALATTRGTGATASFTFDGGLLRAAGASTTYMQALTNASITNNGALIDTNGNNITIAQALTNGTAVGTNGFLTKSGAGTLTLSGSNTYTGATRITTGTLALASTGWISNSGTVVVGTAGSSGVVLDLTAQTSPFSFGAGQTVGGIGTINFGAGKTVSVAGIWAPGNSIGSNAVTGNLSLSGTSQFELGTPGSATTSPGSSDFTSVSGTLTLGGNLALIDNANAGSNGSYGAGSYRLFTAPTLSGTFASVTAPAGATSTRVGMVYTSGTASGQGVFANVYNLASTAATQTVNVGNTRVGTAITGTLTLANTAPANATYTETLSTGGFSNTSANFTASGSASNIAGGGSGSGNMVVGLGAGLTAGGQTGTTTIALFSNAANSSGLAQQSIAAQTITINGGVYDFAQAKYTGGAFSFGNVRTGSTAAAQTIAFGNQTITNSSFQDLLNVSGSTMNSAVTATGFSGLAASGSGSTTQNLSLSASTATAGSLASTVNLTLVSNANGVSGLSNGAATTVGTPAAITTTGGVYDFAQAKYTGGMLDFGIVHKGASVSNQTVAIGNKTVTNASYQDLLDVSGSSTNAAFTVTGFTGLAASANGSTTNNLSVGVSTATAGSLSGTVSLNLVSNANGVADLSNGVATVVGSPAAITTTVGVFSGNGIWNVGSGSWGANASSNWTSDGGVAAAPGTFDGFGSTDTATFGSLASGTATVTIGSTNPSLAAITFNSGTGSYLVSGGAITLSSNTGTAGLSVLAGGHQIASNLSLASLTNVNVATNSILSLSGVISGTGLMQVTGGGLAQITGSNATFTGQVAINGVNTHLSVNGVLGAAGVSVGSGAMLGGSGAIAGVLSGAGLVSPGNSPGILTSGQFNPTGELDVAFELTGTAPTFNAPSASVNDVLRLTSGAPFTSSLGGRNVIDIYFNVNSIGAGDLYEGGFFTTVSAVDLLTKLQSATFNYWVKNPGGTTTFGGVNYSSLASMPGLTGVTLTTANVERNFGDGNVSGSVTQFIIVPEPEAIFLVGIGAALAAWASRRQRR